MGGLALPEGACVWGISWASLCSTPPNRDIFCHLGQPSVGAWGWCQHGGHLPSHSGLLQNRPSPPGAPRSAPC